MASLFDINTPADAVTLDSKGSVSVPFTVKSRATFPLRGRGKLVPLEGTKESWLSVEGELERDFSAGGTQQYVAHLELPAGAPAGRFPFRLDMISVVNPDEDFTEGPVVSTSGVPKVVKPFPWWIVAIIVVVLAVGGTLIGVLTRPKPIVKPSPPAPTTGGSTTSTTGPPPPPTYVTVGSYADTPLATAEADLQSKGLAVYEVDSFASLLKVGQVLSQSPPPGSSVPTGTSVTLTVGARYIIYAHPTLIQKSILVLPQSQ